MENFTFYAPTYFVFGKETEKETGKYVRRFGGTKGDDPYGGGSVVRSGLLDRDEEIIGGRRDRVCGAGRGKTESQKRSCL